MAVDRKRPNPGISGVIRAGGKRIPSRSQGDRPPLQDTPGGGGRVSAEGRDAEKFFRAGIVLMERGMGREAAAAFRRARELDPDDPRYQSYHGLCLATVGRRRKEGLALCRAAAARAFYRPELHLNLGKALSAAGRTREAEEALRQGLALDGNNREIIRELEELGVRRRPLFPFLDRKHPLNRWPGLLRHRLLTKDVS